MTCQECEIKLGMGEEAAEHLASCGECRVLAEELRLNAVALREMRVRPRRWVWAAAAAAAMVITVGLWRGTEKPPERAAAGTIAGPTRQEPAAFSSAPAVRRLPARPKRQAAEPLRVKMYTSDPDVVIYWIVDQKEGSE